MSILVLWIRAFLFTQIVEVPIYRRALESTKRSSLQRTLLAFGASAITHPFVWFVFPRLIQSSYLWMAVAAETFAVLVEGVFLALFGLRQAFLWSMLANAASLGLGLLSREIFGVP